FRSPLRARVRAQAGGAARTQPEGSGPQGDALSEPVSETSQRVNLVLVTGLSGSGKSIVAKCFEDLGYYTVDNLPLPLLEIFIDNPQQLVRGHDRIAVVTDVRAPGFAEEMPRLLANI